MAVLREKTDEELLEAKRICDSLTKGKKCGANFCEATKCPLADCKNCDFEAEIMRRFKKIVKARTPRTRRRTTK